MRINRAAIKQNAKSVLMQTKPSPILVVLVYLAVAAILQVLSASVTGQFAAYMETMEQFMAGNMDYIPRTPSVEPLGLLLNFAIGLMLMVLNAGLAIYCLNVCQFRASGFGNLLDGFAIFFKVLWLEILMGIFVFLWSLLLIIPGIIAAYRYRMALYILIDNPKLGALDCIRASSELMRGHKGELFVLDLSFLGWVLLTAFPFVTVWVTPYMQTTYANYYLALRDMPRPAGDGVYRG
jgi:uncharacterized membrane protein